MRDQGDREGETLTHSGEPCSHFFLLPPQKTPTIALKCFRHVYCVLCPSLRPISSSLDFCRTTPLGVCGKGSAQPASFFYLFRELSLSPSRRCIQLHKYFCACMQPTCFISQTISSLILPPRPLSVPLIISHFLAQSGMLLFSTTWIWILSFNCRMLLFEEIFLHMTVRQLTDSKIH